MKKIFFFLTFICFTGIMNAQTSSNSGNTQTNKLPTNEELIEYFKETEYPYPMSEYYKSFLHEFDSYITAPKLDLNQSESFKQLCNHFLKVPSIGELEPIINEKIHFKLFREDFKYWSIKCKLDNKEHSFLITGAGRIIHRENECNACENIKVKRTQLKKQITEYIDYLKKKYGNLDNAVNELITSPTKLRNQAKNERIEKEKADKQAKRDSLTNAIREINLKIRDNITLNFDNSLYVPISGGGQIRIKNFFVDDDPNASVIASFREDNLILETNEAIWIINDPKKVVNSISFKDLKFYNVLDLEKKYADNIKIPKISPIIITAGRDNKVINEFAPTIIKDKNGDIKRIQPVKFQELQAANTRLKNEVELIQRQCNMVEAYSSKGHFVVKYGNNEKKIDATKSRWKSLLNEWNNMDMTNLNNYNRKKYSQEVHNLLFFESLKPNGGKNEASVPKLYIYETDDIVYIGNSYLAMDIVMNNLSDDVLKIDKNQAFEIKLIYWDQNTTYGGGKYRQKTMYKYKPKKK